MIAFGARSSDFESRRGHLEPSRGAWQQHSG